MTPAARLTWRFAVLPALAVAVLTVVMLACGHHLLSEELTRRALASNQQRADLLGLQLQMSLRDAVSQVPGGATDLIDIGDPVRHPGVQRVREQLALGLGTPEQARDAGLRALVLTSEGGRSVVAGVTVPKGLPSGVGQPRAWQGEDGQRWLLAQAVLQGTPRDTPLLPWRVVVLQSEEAALAPMHALGWSMLAVGVAAALLLGGLGAWLSRRLLMPWDPVFGAVLDGGEPDEARVAARVQALVAERPKPTPTEKLLGWLAHDAGNLRRALDHLPVAFALADRHYRVEYVNPAYTRLLGWTTEATRGRVVGEALVDPAEREALARLHHQLGDPPGEFVQRLDALTPTGERVAVQTHLVPMFDAQGRQVGALSIAHDIRAERHARTQAEALAGRLRALADAALDALLATLDVDGRVLEWSRGAQALTGHTTEQALGRTLDALMPCASGYAAWLRHALIEGSCELALRCDIDGRERRFEGSLYGLGLAPGSARFGLILRDVSERAAQARLIESTRDELGRLNHRLLEQEKHTSRKLAHTLHDELGQTLAALRLHWEAWRSAGAEQRERMDERIANLVVLANRQLRGVLGELRPPLLDELGLAAAIDNEIRQHHASNGASGEALVELEASDTAQLQRWPADVEYAAFMVTREALGNALRHADAGIITVRLDGDEGHLALAIDDDGDGFAEKAVIGGPGLVGMRERALAVGARLHVDGHRGHGTIVELTWENPAEAWDDDEPHLPD